MSTPDLFTITEAAVVLRIGRTTAYELARRDLATGGGEGLCVVRIGGQLRIPRVALEQLIGAPVTAGAEGGAPDDAAPPVAVVPERQPAPTLLSSVVPGRRRHVSSVEQLRFDS